MNLNQEVMEIEAEIRELEEDLGELLLDAPAEAAVVLSPELSELEEALVGTEFDEPVSSELAAGESILDIADDVSLDSQEEFIGGLIDKTKKFIRIRIKRRAGRWIRTIVRLVRKHAKLAKCIPAVTAAIAAFKAKKYGTALKSAISAYKCIKKNM